LMKFYTGHGVPFPFFRSMITTGVKRVSLGLIAYLRHQIKRHGPGPAFPFQRRCFFRRGHFYHSLQPIVH
jgi:hypothetical protein